MFKENWGVHHEKADKKKGQPGEGSSIVKKQIQRQNYHTRW
jgi:hypothetical protein